MSCSILLFSAVSRYKRLSFLKVRGDFKALLVTNCNLGYLTSCFDFLFYNMINEGVAITEVSGCICRDKCSIKGSQMSSHITVNHVDETLGAIPLVRKEEHRISF